MFAAGGVNDDDGHLRFNVNDCVVRNFDRIVDTAGGPLFAGGRNSRECFASINDLLHLCRHLFRGVDVIRREVLTPRVIFAGGDEVVLFRVFVSRRRGHLAGPA